MDKKAILSRVDHTELNPAATWEDIRTLCDDALTYGTATVCIPPCYVRRARSYVGDRLPICTVIGFPHGNSPTAAKAYANLGHRDDGHPVHCGNRLAHNRIHIYHFTQLGNGILHHFGYIFTHVQYHLR